MTQSHGLGRPAEILLVEDDDADVDFARIAFARIKLAHQLHVTRDGEQALQFLQDASKPHPDLILLDLNMPRKGGLTLLQELKQHETWRRIPVIIVTTSSSPGDLERTYDAHANAYLTKKLDLDEWFAQVDATVEFWLRWNLQPT